jgi:hypothetical protein
MADYPDINITIEQPSVPVFEIWLAAPLEMGPPGERIELRNSGYSIDQKYQSESEWTPLIPVEDLQASNYFVKITTTAAEPINAGRLVKIVSGQAYLFDPTDENNYGLLAGIATKSVLLGQQLPIITSGQFENVGAGYTPNEIYFAGINGVPTTNPSGLKIIQPIGMALDSNKLNFNIQQSIITV